MTRAWTGNGSVMPRRSSDAHTALDTPRSAKVALDKLILSEDVFRGEKPDPKRANEDRKGDSTGQPDRRP